VKSDVKDWQEEEGAPKHSEPPIRIAAKPLPKHIQKDTKSTGSKAVILETVDIDDTKPIAGVHAQPEPMLPLPPRVFDKFANGHFNDSNWGDYTGPENIQNMFNVIEYRIIPSIYEASNVSFSSGFFRLTFPKVTLALEF
jgi:hypothetical protein